MWKVKKTNNKSKANQTVKGIIEMRKRQYILTGSGFLHHGVRNCGFGKLDLLEFKKNSLQYDMVQM